MIDFGMWGFEFLVIGDAGFVNGGRSGFHVFCFDATVHVMQFYVFCF